MDRFAEVWAKILETFQKVINTILAIFEGIGNLGGDEE